VGVHGYALVFSLVSRQSFERISQINEALLHALGDAQDIPRVLVGTMRDMTDQRHVSRQVGSCQQSPLLFPNINPSIHLFCYRVKGCTNIG
jgi:hypothetical protein